MAGVVAEADGGEVSLRSAFDIRALLGRLFECTASGREGGSAESIGLTIATDGTRLKPCGHPTS